MKLDTEHTFFTGLGDMICFAWIAEGMRQSGDILRFYAHGWKADVLRLFQQEVTDDDREALVITRAFDEGLTEGTDLDYMEWIASQIAPWSEPIRPRADFSPTDRHFGREMARDVLLFPQTTAGCRQWPVAYWIDLANLLRLEGLRVAIVLQGFEGVYQCSPVPVIHGQNIERVAAAMQASFLVIGNDSGPAHLSATLGTKTLVLQGSTTERIYSHLPEVECLRVKQMDCSGCHGVAEKWRPACSSGCQELFRLFPADVAHHVTQNIFAKEAA